MPPEAVEMGSNEKPAPTPAADEKTVEQLRAENQQLRDLVVDLARIVEKSLAKDSKKSGE